MMRSSIDRGFAISALIVDGAGYFQAYRVSHIGTRREFQIHISRRDIDVPDGIVRYFIAEFVNGKSGRPHCYDSFDGCITLAESTVSAVKIARHATDPDNLPNMRQAAKARHSPSKEESIDSGDITPCATDAGWARPEAP
ncbi:MAG: hypothetical protein DDT34_01157 [Firmicutes bacterium]|nr:hypothetical protein [Bacillota bacterium]MBT9165635.1 hypothetical protein [Chloroflexota bacterium]